MSSERVIPGLPCRDLDDVLPFYTALGFETTYRQQRPNPFASVERGGIALHFFSVPGFDPADSMGTVVIVVPDTDQLHRAFADGLRAAFGKVPVAGIPRMTRPRRRQGTSRGFSVVDPGGNWLRIHPQDDDRDEPTEEEGRLGRAVAAAARQADSRGDVPAGIRVLENVCLDTRTPRPTSAIRPSSIWPNYATATGTRRPPRRCWSRPHGSS